MNVTFIIPTLFRYETSWKPTGSVFKKYNFAFHFKTMAPSLLCTWSIGLWSCPCPGPRRPRWRRPGGRRPYTRARCSPHWPRRMRRLRSLPGLRGDDCRAAARLHLPTLASPPLVWNGNSVKLCRRLFHRNISEQTSERKYFIREQNQGFKTSGKLEMEHFYQKEPILIKLFSR